MSRMQLMCGVALAIAATVLSGCSMMTRSLDRVFPDKRTEYQQAESLPDLEIPPELSNDRIQDRLAIPPENAAPNATFRERAATRTEAPAAAPASAATTRNRVATTTVAADSTAAAPVSSGRAQLISAGVGKIYIQLHEAIEPAWQSVGAALRATGLTIEKSKPKRGIYKVRASADAEQKEGFISKLAFWRKDGSPLYQVSLTEAGADTEIVILDDDGDWDTSAEAGQLLTALYARLR